MTTLVNEAYCDEPVDKYCVCLFQADTHSITCIIHDQGLYKALHLDVCLCAYEITDVTKRNGVQVMVYT